MFNTFTYKYLHWRTPSPSRPPLPPALPDGIERLFIPAGNNSPDHKLEILYAKPKPTSPQNGPSPPKSPLFFCHGGMGCASYWLEYMTFFASHGIPCYAISYRGHGNSWYPSFLRMVYGTMKGMLAEDIVAGIRWVQGREDSSEEGVVLVGHSSGGGLVQLILSDAKRYEIGRVKGLVLAAAVPGFGSMGVYLNWFKLDPWFSFRMIFHGWHPNSPLSHPALTRKVFFSNQQTDSYIANFQKLSAPYESFLWPLGMMYFRFVNPLRVLGSISGWDSGSSSSPKVLVLAGGGDKIMTLDIMTKLAGFYQQAYGKLVEGKKIDGPASPSQIEADPGEGGLDTAGQGVKLAVVPGAGHHLHNDVQWEVGARKLLEFYEQL